MHPRLFNSVRVACGLLCGLLLLPATAVANPLVWYKFDEGSGMMLMDHSGNNHHGFLLNFADTSAGFGNGGPNGWLAGGGLKFGGNPGLQAPRVETPFHLLSNLVGQSFTVEMIVSHTGGVGQTWSPYVGQSGGCCFFIGKQSGATNLHHNIAGLGSGNSVGRPGNLPLTNGQPRHIALVYNASTARINTFLDHVRIGSFAAGAALQERGNLWLGAVAHSPINEFWGGNAYETRISQGALSVSQMLNAPVLSPVSSFSFANFSDVSPLTFVNHATTGLDGAIPIARLTNNAGSQAGAVYYKQPVSLAGDFSFSTYFATRIYDGGGGPDVAGDPLGADGMTFVIHNDIRGTAALGGAGGALAVHDITPALIVELDTWHGGTFDPATNAGVNGDHIAINVNRPGIPQLSIAQTGPRPLGSGLNDGTVKHIWVDYDGNTKQLRVFGSQDAVKPSSPLLQQTIFLEHLFNTNDLIVGFTAGTGGAVNKHDVRAWDFSSSPSTSSGGPPVRDFGPTVGSAAINMADMSDLSGWTLKGSAAPFGNRLRLTPSAGSQGGAAWLTDAIHMPSNFAFNAAFSFEISAPGGASDGIDGLGADGMLFAIQADPRNQHALGGGGGAMGLDGVLPQVSVGIDTWPSGSWDVAGNNGMHIEINTGPGSNPSIAQTPAVGQPGMPRLNDGGVNYMWVDYDGTTMSVYLSDTPVKPASALLSANIDLASIFGPVPNTLLAPGHPGQLPVRFGFTAGTGGAINAHDVLSFNLTVVPEPSSVVLALCGLGGAVALRRRLARR
jgi:hypothetical protein